MERILDPTTNPQSRRNNALKLLGWVAYAKRPLRWHEIQGAMAIDTVDGVFDPSLKFAEMEDCKDVCASLIEESTDGLVVLVHSTAKG
jgi:hypothetical protein